MSEEIAVGCCLSQASLQTAARTEVEMRPVTLRSPSHTDCRKSSDILSGRSSDILSDILCISPGILGGISSDILSGILCISADILSGISSDILSGISSDVLSGISSDILSDILSGISSDILSDSLSGILSDILSGVQAREGTQAADDRG